jgi:isochorismate synthase
VTPARQDCEPGPLRILTIPAPAIALDQAFAYWPDQANSLLWDPPRGPSVTAFGVAARAIGSGANRVSELLAASAIIWPRITNTGPANAPAPRLWGGLAFAPGTAAADGWKEFGDATFFLPRISYWRDGERAWLQIAGAEDEKALAAEANRVCAELSRGSGGNASAPQQRPERPVPAPDTQVWRKQVADILAAIAAGEVGKVVAARCTRILFADAPSVSRVLLCLTDEARNAWRFALSRNGNAFLGATPEMLVARHGAIVESEAMAGTLDKSAGCPEDLLASAKDQDEHRFVLQGILAALRPLCGHLDVPAAPSVRELRELFHLASTIRGHLRRPLHLLELCEKLHPTPATGGTPRMAAVERILASEPVPRGWYGAPVGWFDASGDGELVVALRSGLVTRDCAYVYAGAGIVAGSNADDELAETQLKQRTVLRALGFEVA